MSQFFETIKFSQGEFFLLDFHQERLNRTRRDALGVLEELDLSFFLNKTPDDLGTYRCRVDYGKTVEKVTYHRYKLAEHRNIGFVDARDYDYRFKHKNRDFLENPKKELNVDDVIFLKNGLLTDASYANLAFFKDGIWYTPKSCLLRGVKRAFLLHQGLLVEKDIPKVELDFFEKVAFINALRDFELVYSFQLKNDKMKLTLVE